MGTTDREKLMELLSKMGVPHHMTIQGEIIVHAGDSTWNSGDARAKVVFFSDAGGSLYQMGVFRP